MSTAVVLGGGASGLASAYYIKRYLPQFAKVIVLEGSNRVGGWVNTTTNPDGSLFEQGPRSLRPVGEQGKNTLQLADELGLERDVLPVFQSDVAAKNRFLFMNGKLCMLPNSIKGVLTTVPPFSKPLIGTFALEPFRQKSNQPDESVYSFFSRRFSQEMADVAIDAMCRGIYAGDCRKLSMQACFPPIHEMEQSYGSLGRALLFGRKKNSKAPLTGLAQKAHQEKWSTWSLRHGMQQLTDSMAEAVKNSPGSEIRLNTKCKGLQPKDGKIIVTTDSDTINADLVMAGIYSKDLSSLLPNSMSDLRDDLVQLPAVDVVVVNLEFKENVLPVKGFGHLLPSSEKGPVLGIVYDSCAFPEHNRKGSPNSSRITVMMGGSWYDRLLTADGSLPSGSDLLRIAWQAASTQLGIRAHPIRSLVTLHKACIPQYRIGHVNWVKGLEDKIQSHNLPLKLVGASYRGPAINDCINNARKSILALKRD